MLQLGDTISFQKTTPKDLLELQHKTAKTGYYATRSRSQSEYHLINEFIYLWKMIYARDSERQRPHRYIMWILGKFEAVLSKQEQIPNEVYKPHDRL